jgi:hypothetical protein
MLLDMLLLPQENAATMAPAHSGMGTITSFIQRLWR